MLSVTCISDTHLEHDKLVLHSGDVLIHSGDILKFSRNFDRTKYELKQFIDWFASQKYRYKILIAGNHDLILQSDQREMLLKYIKASGIIYLENTSVIIEGFKFYGSPNTNITGMAFGLDEKNLKTIYEKIPQDVDVLITHPPPYGILDIVKNNSQGCSILRSVVDIVKPKYHIFGHIHESRGFLKTPNTTFINCAIVPNNKPIKFQLNR